MTTTLPTRITDTPRPDRRSRRPSQGPRESSPWDLEYDRDVWRLRELGFDTRTRARISFEAIPHQWLKDLTKRWTRWRLVTGSGESTAATGVAAVSRFAAFLASVPIESVDQLDRDVLERYLAHLHAQLAGRQVHRNMIGQLNVFFTAIRQHGWEPALPATVMFFPEDLPKGAEALPRALSDAVMAQLEHPDNLARWRNADHRLITQILMRCGLRITDAVRLPRDCVTRDADGAPYLRYFNHKMDREALVPIDDELEHAINEHHGRLQDRWPRGTPVMFPMPRNNPDGLRPLGASTYRKSLNRWLERCNIRDEHGQPVKINPHRFRHTLGTQLIVRRVASDATTGGIRRIA